MHHQNSKRLKYTVPFVREWQCAGVDGSTQMEVESREGMSSLQRTIHLIVTALIRNEQRVTWKGRGISLEKVARPSDVLSVLASAGDISCVVIVIE